MLARFLALPLQAFDRLVTQTESSAGFSALRPWVTVGRVAGTHAAFDAEDSLPTGITTVLGDIREGDRRLIFVYRRDSYVRAYQFDEDGVTRLLSQPNSSTELAGVLRRLRLINTRNRLTHALMQMVLKSQAAYLRSGQPLMLVPLTQATIAARLRSTSTLSVVADPGRISRLVRGLSITLPNSRVTPLSTLFPKPRQVYRHFVDHMIQEETARMFQGVQLEPLTDAAIAAILEREYGLRLSRRTISNVRHDLAIPDCRSRSQRMHYLAATEGFSALVPLTTQVLRASVPAHSGVYEIRTEFTSRPTEKMDGCTEKPHSVLYIGSAVNLRKRLGDHLRGNSDNALLFTHIAAGATRVRFRLIGEGWRLVERDLYRVFCETFGAPPPCNRMSP